MRIQRFIRPLVLGLMLMSIPALSFGGVFVSVSIGPPPIPVYTQPLCPAPGYIWTPGYWAWGDDGYYWVPGTWVMAPQPGYLWTPGYWGYEGSAYLWHGGYWGPHVGFYGGINYGFGYTGAGYYGGEWRGDRFYYNRSVSHVNVTNVTNVYNKTVIVNNNTHVSYNGGNGVHAQPTAEQRRWEGERHVEPTRQQNEHFQQAAHNPQLLARNNGGRPAIAATDRPGDFKGHVVGARAAGGPVNREALNATPKNMPARNAERGNANGGTREVPRPGNNNDRAANVPRPGNNARESNNVPRPGNNTREANNVPRPGNNTREANVSRPANNAPAARDNARNVPHPPTANNNSRNEGGNTNSRNVPRPSANSNGGRENAARSTATPARPVAPPRESAQERGNSRSSAPERGAAPARQAAAPHVSSAPAPHESAPRASAPRESAPAEHNNGGGHNEKPHR